MILNNNNSTSMNSYNNNHSIVDQQHQQRHNSPLSSSQLNYKQLNQFPSPILSSSSTSSLLRVGVSSPSIVSRSINVANAPSSPSLLSSTNPSSPSSSSSASSSLPTYPSIITNNNSNNNNHHSDVIIPSISPQDVLRLQSENESLKKELEALKLTLRQMEIHNNNHSNTTNTSLSSSSSSLSPLSSSSSIYNNISGGLRIPPTITIQQSNLYTYDLHNNNNSIFNSNNNHYHHNHPLSFEERALAAIQQSRISKQPLPLVDSQPSFHAQQYLSQIQLNHDIYTMITYLKPHKQQEAKRINVLSFLKLLARKSLGSQVYPIGPYALKTYLPNESMDVSAFFSRAHDTSWLHRLVNALVQEAANYAHSLYNASSLTTSSPHYAVSKLSVNFSKAQPVITCTIGGIGCNIYGNHVTALSHLALFEYADQCIAQSHLFKSTVLLFKCWCLRQGIAKCDGGLLDVEPSNMNSSLSSSSSSSSFTSPGTDNNTIITTDNVQHGLLNTLFMKTLVLFAFNTFGSIIHSPLHGLFYLLQYLSTFNWDEYALTIHGPVSLNKLESDGKIEYVNANIANNSNNSNMNSTAAAIASAVDNATPVITREIVQQHGTKKNISTSIAYDTTCSTPSALNDSNTMNNNNSKNVKPARSNSDTSYIPSVRSSTNVSSLSHASNVYGHHNIGHHHPHHHHHQQAFGHHSYSLTSLSSLNNNNSNNNHNTMGNSSLQHALSQFGSPALSSPYSYTPTGSSTPGSLTPAHSSSDFQKLINSDRSTIQPLSIIARHGSNNSLASASSFTPTSSNHLFGNVPYIDNGNNTSSLNNSSHNLIDDGDNDDNELLLVDGDEDEDMIGAEFLDLPSNMKHDMDYLFSSSNNNNSTPSSSNNNNNSNSNTSTSSCEEQLSSPFTRCSMNVLDPLDSSHNLGTSISYRHEYAIRKTLMGGYQSLLTSLQKYAFTQAAKYSNSHLDASESEDEQHNNNDNNSSGNNNNANTTTSQRKSGPSSADEMPLDIDSNAVLAEIFDCELLCKYKEYTLRQSKHIKQSPQIRGVSSPSVIPSSLTLTPSGSGNRLNLLDDNSNNNNNNNSITASTAASTSAAVMSSQSAASSTSSSSSLWGGSSILSPFITTPPVSSSSLATTSTTSIESSSSSLFQSDVAADRTPMKLSQADASIPIASSLTPVAVHNTPAAIPSTVPNSTTTATATASATTEQAFDAFDGNLSKILENLEHARQFSTPDLNEDELVNLVIDILSVRGSAGVPVGRLGSLLHDKTNNHSLPALLKERFGGLKKLVEKHADVFIVGSTHPYNPSVSLRHPHLYQHHKHGLGHANPLSNSCGNINAQLQASSSSLTSSSMVGGGLSQSNSNDDINGLSRKKSQRRRTRTRRNNSGAGNSGSKGGIVDMNSNTMYPVSSLSSHNNNTSGTNTPRPALTNVIAMDCEMVGCGQGGLRSMIARVSIVNYMGENVYDKYVRNTETVTDYRTSISGIQAHHLVNGIDFKQMQREVSQILKNRIIVGHGLQSDLQALCLSIPRHCIRDTAHCKLLCPQRPKPLKVLLKERLNISIQDNEDAGHNSIEDARAALFLYRHVEQAWENIINQELNNNQILSRSINHNNNNNNNHSTTSSPSTYNASTNINGYNNPTTTTASNNNNNNTMNYMHSSIVNSTNPQSHHFQQPNVNDLYNNNNNNTNNSNNNNNNNNNFHYVNPHVTTRSYSTGNLADLPHTHPHYYNNNHQYTPMNNNNNNNNHHVDNNNNAYHVSTSHFYTHNHVQQQQQQQQHYHPSPNNNFNMNANHTTTVFQ